MFKYARCNINKNSMLKVSKATRNSYFLTMPILIINYLAIISSCNTVSESTIPIQFCFIQLCICTPFVMSNKKKILDMHQTMTAPRIIIKAFSFIEDSNSNLCLLLNTYNEYS